MTETLRLELWDQPVRVTEIAPGMVHTDEFSLVRFGGDQDKPTPCTPGVKEPLVADDVADAITWMVTRPSTSTSTSWSSAARPGRPAQGAPRAGLTSGVAAVSGSTSPASRRRSAVRACSGSSTRPTCGVSKA